MNVPSEVGSGDGGGSGSGPGSGRGSGLKTARDAVALAREAEEDALLENVKSFLKRKQTRSPTHFGRRLKVGDLVLRKRTSFTAGSARKMAFKSTKECNEITHRVATNAFRCKSLLDGKISLIPGDHLLKTRGQTKDSLVYLCKRMEEIAVKNEASASPPLTRRRTALLAPPEANNLFISDVGIGDTKEGVTADLRALYDIGE